MTVMVMIPGDENGGLYPQNDDDNRLDDIMTQLGLAGAGVDGPGLPGLGLAGNLEWLKQWLRDHFGPYWWLFLVAALVLLAERDRR